MLFDCSGNFMRRCFSCCQLFCADFYTITCYKFYKNTENLHLFLRTKGLRGERHWMSVHNRTNEFCGKEDFWDERTCYKSVWGRRSLARIRKCLKQMTYIAIKKKKIAIQLNTPSTLSTMLVSEISFPSIL